MSLWQLKITSTQKYNTIEFGKYDGDCKLIGQFGMEHNLIIYGYMVIIKMKLREILKIGSMYHY